MPGKSDFRYYKLFPLLEQGLTVKDAAPLLGKPKDWIYAKITWLKKKGCLFPGNGEPGRVTIPPNVQTLLEREKRKDGLSLETEAPRAYPQLPQGKPLATPGLPHSYPEVSPKGKPKATPPSKPSTKPNKKRGLTQGKPRAEENGQAESLPQGKPKTIEEAILWIDSLTKRLKERQTEKSKPKVSPTLPQGLPSATPEAYLEIIRRLEGIEQRLSQKQERDGLPKATPGLPQGKPLATLEELLHRLHAAHKERTKRIMFHLEPSLIDRLKAQADRLEASQSRLVGEAIERLLMELERK